MKHLLLILTLGLTMLFTVTHAMGQTNIALGKVATQSSDAFPNGLASNAVDGNTDGNFANGSVTHTTGMSRPWWKVELGADHQITEIRIWNRTDCCAERLNNIYIAVWNAKGERIWNHTLPSAAETNPIILPVNVTGSLVQLVINKVEDEYLSLAEVEVFGSPFSKPAPVPTPVPLVNLARGAQVSQSSTFSEGYAERAVDGNSDGDWSNGSVTHTQEEYHASLVVDLGSVKKIKRIYVYNRTDCCRERLGEFWVLFSDTPFSTNYYGKFYGKGGYNINGDTHPFVFDNGVFFARYVRIMLPGTGYLSLAEVEIMGYQ